MSRLDRETIAALNALRDTARREGWTRWRLVSAIRLKTGDPLLACHRYAEGWSQSKAAARLSELVERLTGRDGPVYITPARLCHWERGDRPGQEYLDALCQLYRTRPDRLGFGNDYSPPGEGEHAAPPQILAAVARKHWDGAPGGDIAKDLNCPEEVVRYWLSLIDAILGEQGIEVSRDDGLGC